MNGETPRLDRALRAAWRRRRAVRALRTSGVWCSAFLVGLFAVLALDWAGGFAWWVRLFAGLALASLALVGSALSVRLLASRAKQEDRGALARDMEGAWGIEPGVLRSADELETGEHDDAVARALVARTHARAEAAVARVDPPAPVDRFGPGVRVWWPALGAAVLLGVFGAVDAPALRTTVTRLVDPLGDHPPVSATRVTLTLASEAVLVGDRPAVRVVCEGVAPASAWLDVDGTRVTLNPDGELAWSAVLAPVHAPVTVRAHTPTGYSRALRIEPLAFARVVDTRVTVLPPAHAAGLAPERPVSWERGVTCATGSTLRVEMVTSAPTLGARDASGSLVGAPSGRTLVIELDAVTGAVDLTPVTAAGDGPEGVRFDVVVREDEPARVRFVGVGDAVTVVEGGEVTLRALASDDVALADPGVRLSAGVRDLRGVRDGHDRAFGAITVRGDDVDSVIEVRAIASDTAPGREPTEAVVRVLVISREEAAERRLDALTLDALTAPALAAADALDEAVDGGAGAEGAAREALEELASTSGTDFDEEVASAAEALAERVDEVGVTASTALEAERTLRAPAERLALADALRRAAELLVALTERQGALAERVSVGGFDTDAESAVQSAHAQELESIAAALRTLGARAASGRMDPDRLATLRAALREERALVLALCEGLGDEEDARRLRDLALTELFFVTEPLLDEQSAGDALMTSAGASAVLVGRMHDLAAGVGGEDLREDLREALLVVRELSLAIGREATPVLPAMGASALDIAGRIERSGVGGVMRGASAALESGDADGPALAREAHDLLLALRDVRASGESEGAGDDAPLSLTPGASDEAAGASAPSGSSDAGRAPSALERLAQNRARGDGGGETEPGDGREPEAGDAAPEGGAMSSSGGGSGGTGGLALGGQAVEGSGEEDGASPIERPDAAAGVARWVEAELLELTPGEAERLARVPERYRALVSAYLRAVDDASGRDAGGRIGDR